MRLRTAVSLSRRMSVRIESMSLHSFSMVVVSVALSSCRIRRLRVGWCFILSSTKEANFFVALVSLHQKPRDGVCVGVCVCL